MVSVGQRMKRGHASILKFLLIILYNLQAVSSTRTEYSLRVTKDYSAEAFTGSACWGKTVPAAARMVKWHPTSRMRFIDFLERDGPGKARYLAARVGCHAAGAC